MVIGLVNGVAVPLHLVRESAANMGLRVFGLQQSLTPGTSDGSYAMVSVKGENHDATVAGSGFNLGGAAAALSYDTPVLGVAQSDAGRPGNFIFNSGILAFVSNPGANAALELGVRH
jgi:feruloyl esterase